MRITFYGAAQEVTGSMHLIEVNDRKVLLECGLFQGKRAESYERNLNFPFDPAEIDVLILSHAHIDHSGNIPNLVKQGFRGNIWCTAATRNLCTYMLMDSGHIQESDVEFVNRQRHKEGLPPVAPIYTQRDAQECFGLFATVGLDRRVIVADGVEATFLNAGHILGAASVALDIREFATGKAWRVLFSGDVGRVDSPILMPPVSCPDADVIIMESTYGDRLHEGYDDARRKLRTIIHKTIKRHGKIIIPAFAVGRTQELIYVLNQLDADGDIPDLPVFVDSPLAVNTTAVFRMHPEAWRPDVRRFLTEEGMKTPFDYAEVEYVYEARRSKQLNTITTACIIISASGMAESGRILHHLKNNIEDPNNTILTVSFCAENTLGRKLQDGEPRVRIFGQEYTVRADVQKIDGYSAHADQAELLAWVGQVDKDRVQQLFLVHGELEGAETLAGELRKQGFAHVAIPERLSHQEF
jgi:metallo-beta-lactamase family protein